MRKEHSTRSVIGGLQSQSTQCVKRSLTYAHTRLETCSFQNGSGSSEGPLLCGASREIKRCGRQVCRTHQQAPGYTRGLKKQQGAVLSQQACLRRQGSYGVHGCNAPEDGCARSRGLSARQDFPGSMTSSGAVAPAVGARVGSWHGTLERLRGRPTGVLALSHPQWDPVSPVMAEAGSLGSLRGPSCASGTFAETARLVGAR